MNRIAFIFPGQGSQAPGMGRDVATDPAVENIYRTADRVLGFELSRICFDGGAENLRDTSVTQPGVFVTSLVFDRLLRERGISPAVVTGHSLGDYTALVAAGAVEWTTALRLVRRRGELMAKVNRYTPGAMAAVLGLPLDRVEELCEDVSSRPGHFVQVANINTADQTVVSGDEAGVSALVKAAKSSDARDAVPLKVGAPFHSELMRPIEEEFASHLDKEEFQAPSIPVVSSVSGEYIESGEEARALLRAQPTAPVLWSKVLRLLVDERVSTLVEVGPGRVLTNLARSEAPRTPAMRVGTLRALDKAVERLRPHSA
ncbi:ACP S-malonyltransferase [Nocardiopsis alba]|uniref:ACP S-malonyltransferase n=1 Tax=Nocardiopsis alba TaxID=53437 RepID=UPI0033E17BB1